MFEINLHVILISNKKALILLILINDAISRFSYMSLQRKIKVLVPQNINFGTKYMR